MIIEAQATLNPKAAAVAPMVTDPEDGDRTDREQEGGGGPVPEEVRSKLRIGTGQREYVVDHFGQQFKHVFVRCPEQMTQQDLPRPEIWADVQQSPQRSLRKFDTIFLTSFHEDWYAEGRVIDARVSGVHVAWTRVRDIGRRFERLFESEFYKVEWCGIGYGIFRKADNVRVGRAEPDALMAERIAMEMTRNAYSARA